MYSKLRDHPKKITPCSSTSIRHDLQSKDDTTSHIPRMCRIKIFQSHSWQLWNDVYKWNTIRKKNKERNFNNNWIRHTYVQIICDFLIILADVFYDDVLKIIRNNYRVVSCDALTLYWLRNRHSIFLSEYLLCSVDHCREFAITVTHWFFFIDTSSSICPTTLSVVLETWILVQMTVRLNQVRWHRTHRTVQLGGIISLLEEVDDVLVSPRFGLIRRLTTRLHDSRKWIAFKTKSANRSNNSSLLNKILGKSGHRTICLNLDSVVLIKTDRKTSRNICVPIVDVCECVGWHRAHQSLDHMKWEAPQSNRSRIHKLSLFFTGTRQYPHKREFRQILR